MALSPQHQGAIGFDTLPPEIQQEICNYLAGDRASLFAAIRVSRACYNCCIGMLWRNSTQKGLAKASTHARRQYYANMIYDWNLNHGRAWKMFDRLESPLLEGITFSGGGLSNVQLRRCLKMGLQTLRYIRCEFDATILELIATCCTQLRELDVTFPTTHKITPSQFAKFVQSFPDLQCLRLHGIRRYIMNEVFKWQSPLVAQLEELALTGYWDSDDHYPTTVAECLFRNNFLERCTGLRELRVDGGEGFSVRTFARLSSFDSLEVFYIDG